jgi:hypothetical protein
MTPSHRGASAGDRPGERGRPRAVLTARGSACGRAFRTFALLGSALPLGSGCSSVKEGPADSRPDAEATEPSDADTAGDATTPIDAAVPSDAALPHDATLSDERSAELDASQADAAPADAALGVSLSEVHSILMEKCVPCHTADGGNAYPAFVDSHAVLSNASKLCPGDVVATCVGLAVENEIPEGPRCRTAVVKPFHREGWQCLSAGERATIQAWVDAGLQGP